MPSKDILLRYARLGAEERILRIREELATIYREFPELRPGGGNVRAASAGAAPARSQPPAGSTPAPGRKARRRRKMTAAERKAVSERMRKYWAERMKAKK